MTVLKHVDGWCLHKRMRSTVSVGSIPGARTKSMLHHGKGCLKHTFPDFIILNDGTNDLNGNSASQGVAEKILNLATLIKTSKNQVFVSNVVIRKDKLNEKGNEVNELLKNKCGIRQLSFIDNKNISLGMLNKSGIHFNEYSITRLVNNFCFSMNAGRDENSFRNKIAVHLLITNDIGICLRSETKILESFPNIQFNISNYKTFRRDRNKHGRGLLFCINENIPCKLINDQIIPSDIETVMLEFLKKA